MLDWRFGLVIWAFEPLVAEGKCRFSEEADMGLSCFEGTPSQKHMWCWRATKRKPQSFLLSFSFSWWGSL